MRLLQRLGLPALLLSALGFAGWAQIQTLSLPEIVDRTEGAVYGEIISKRAFKVFGPEGRDYYFTTLTIEGSSTSDGTPITVDVTYHGGFVTETDGVHNSEAPTADDVRVGNRILAFYSWADDMGGGHSANVLHNAHGGLYRTVDGPRGTTVLGRGTGYPIARNTSMTSMQSALRRLYSEKKKR